ncbi:MAG: FG-GAP-like repeat-containing protein [Candidatus Zixiibacteriota bacterium]
MAKVIVLSVLLYVLFVTGGLAQVPLEDTTFWESSEENVYSTGLIWRDCNNDGYIDAFFSNGNDIVQAKNFIYLSNYGKLPQSASWYSSDNEYSGHCTVGDVDDNGYPDFAVANFLGDGAFSTMNVSNLYLNMDGLPNTTADWHNGDSVFTFSCAFGDADGDGDLDLAFSTGMSYGGPALYDYIYYNVDGVLQTTPGWQSDVPTEAMDVTWGDVDNNGYLDLAFCYDDKAAEVYYNYNGVIETTPSWHSSLPSSANTVIFGDINGDGWLDLVVAFNYQNSGQGYYRVYYNDGTGMLEEYPSWRSGDGGYGSAIALYDYDNDGDDDLAAGRWWDKLRVYENLGDSLSSNPVWRAGPATVVEEVAWIDVDGDGVEEFADTVYTAGDRKLFYTEKHPLQSIDSVYADGTKLANADYCYDIIDGWVSLGNEPGDNIIIFYQFSYKNDVTISNWDTYNMAFGNNSKPYVDFYADVSVGHAPLEVQFTDSSVGATQWMWNFGDGDAADVKDPIHTFLEGGAYDVRLQNLLPDRWHNRTRKKMIVALADTLYMPQIVGSVGDTIKMSIYLKNSQPMKSLIMPISYGGPLQLDYLDFDTDSCRSDYFDRVNMIAFSPFEGKATFSFTPDLYGNNPPLEPGYGRLINIYFILQSGVGTNILDTTTLSGKQMNLDAYYVNYQPFVVTGYVSQSAQIKGDANADGAINILDIVFLIKYLYKGGPAPDPYAGDVDSNGAINLLDITYLINYLYRGGPPPIL